MVLPDRTAKGERRCARARQTVKELLHRLFIVLDDT